VKLELTHACNLRCDFCYTDSPRRTLERAVDLSDDAWRAVVEDAIELGVMEAVVTGGEPLLRTPLTLELVERLTGAGVAVAMNTNGWFVDEAVAARLGRLPGLVVNISIDGATPDLHDGSRGVPGSWRRAIRAVALLLEHGARVAVVHVVTPRNESTVAEFYEHMALLGVRLLRVTPVVPVGAASRADGWAVDVDRLRRLAERATRASGMRIIVQPGEPELSDDVAPASVLVRPLGSVWTDSLHPFRFGHVDEGLARCWERVRAGWRDPRITTWAGEVRAAGGLAHASVVPYADDEADLSEAATTPSVASTPAREPKRAVRSTERPAEHGDLAAARTHVEALALARRYRRPVMRGADEQDGSRILRVPAVGRTFRINPSAALLLDALDGTTVGEAVAVLSARHPELTLDRAQRDALTATASLCDLGLLLPGKGERSHPPTGDVPLADLPDLAAEPA
jgi:MoaA/NifB/PqqE/SkfB family radical SAM enzyme